VKKLEAENARLKRLFADMALENAAMKHLIAKKLLSRMGSGKRRGIWWTGTGFQCAESAIA
jgi:hypothetical protein